MPAKKPNLPDVIMSAAQSLGGIFVTITENNPKLKAKIERELGKAAKRATSSSFLTDLANAGRLAMMLQGTASVFVTDEAKAVVDAASPFEILGVSPSAPMEVITAAYRALAAKHHPDRGGDPQKMQEINIAYEAIQKARK